MTEVAMGYGEWQI